MKRKSSSTRTLFSLTLSLIVIISSTNGQSSRPNLVQLGYSHSWPSEEGWFVAPSYANNPALQDKFSYYNYGNVESLLECAKKCQKRKTPGGSYSPITKLCYCDKVLECVEPVIIERGGIVFSNEEKPRECARSYCDYFPEFVDFCENDPNVERRTEQPTQGPTKRPTFNPTESPTVRPTSYPTKRPTEGPTEGPTRHPTQMPTDSPTRQPTDSPTESPTDGPTRNPTNSPTRNPTNNPTLTPTKMPITPSPTSKAPTKAPVVTPRPTHRPTRKPNPEPSTRDPTKQPTKQPTKAPTISPTLHPTTENPTLHPTPRPTRGRSSDTRPSTSSGDDTTTNKPVMVSSTASPTTVDNSSSDEVTVPPPTAMNDNESKQKSVSITPFTMNLIFSMPQETLFTSNIIMNKSDNQKLLQSTKRHLQEMLETKLERGYELISLDLDIDSPNFRRRRRLVTVSNAQSRSTAVSIPIQREFRNGQLVYTSSSEGLVLDAEDMNEFTGYAFSGKLKEAFLERLVGDVDDDREQEGTNVLKYISDVEVTMSAPTDPDDSDIESERSEDDGKVDAPVNPIIQEKPPELTDTSDNNNNNMFSSQSSLYGIIAIAAVAASSIFLLIGFIILSRRRRNNNNQKRSNNKPSSKPSSKKSIDLNDPEWRIPGKESTRITTTTNTNINNASSWDRHNTTNDEDSSPNNSPDRSCNTDNTSPTSTPGRNITPNTSPNTSPNISPLHSLLNNNDGINSSNADATSGGRERGLLSTRFGLSRVRNGMGSVCSVSVSNKTQRHSNVKQQPQKNAKFVDFQSSSSVTSSVFEENVEVDTSGNSTHHQHHRGFSRDNSELLLGSHREAEQCDFVAQGNNAHYLTDEAQPQQHEDEIMRRALATNPQHNHLDGNDDVDMDNNISTPPRPSNFWNNHHDEIDNNSNYQEPIFLSSSSSPSNKIRHNQDDEAKMIEYYRNLEHDEQYESSDVASPSRIDETDDDDDNRIDQKQRALHNILKKRSMPNTNDDENAKGSVHNITPRPTWDEEEYNQVKLKLNGQSSAFESDDDDNNAPPAAAEEVFMNGQGYNIRNHDSFSLKDAAEEAIHNHYHGHDDDDDEQQFTDGEYSYDSYHHHHDIEQDSQGSTALILAEARCLTAADRDGNMRTATYYSSDGASSTSSHLDHVNEQEEEYYDDDDDDDDESNATFDDVVTDIGSEFQSEVMINSSSDIVHQLLQQQHHKNQRIV